MVMVKYRTKKANFKTFVPENMKNIKFLKLSKQEIIKLPFDKYEEYVKESAIGYLN